MTTLIHALRASRPMRSLAFGFAASAALVAGAEHLGAQAIAAHNSKAPVNYAADRIELQDKQNRVVLLGNVDISQADLTMRASRTTVAYTDAGSLQIQRIDATGGVVVTRGSERATGDVAVYDFDRKIITMAGNVALRRGSDTLSGGRLVIDLNTGISNIDGRSVGGGGAETRGTGRVSGSFTVPKN
ncbi:OstA family protein [Novosphingobium fuchskuhlense]|uniref:OstA family protein n=1 Tax=Novosphingobium fuchskuhlense TaxID=1117702 RepID=A0A117UZH2_9SPHN|nr:LptA/OstA family protein [Novosphingobium fuchskuhlense]KUR73701.1 OstA family protein [Novosphingobium fuchskuhlense]